MVINPVSGERFSNASRKFATTRCGRLFFGAFVFWTCFVFRRGTLKHPATIDPPSRVSAVFHPPLRLIILCIRPLIRPPCCFCVTSLNRYSFFPSPPPPPTLALTPLSPLSPVPSFGLPHRPSRLLCCLTLQPLPTPSSSYSAHSFSNLSPPALCFSFLFHSLYVLCVVCAVCNVYVLYV